jgi:hypothetical protein
MLKGNTMTTMLKGNTMIKGNTMVCERRLGVYGLGFRPKP